MQFVVRSQGFKEMLDLLTDSEQRIARSTAATCLNTLARDVRRQQIRQVSGFTGVPSGRVRKRVWLERASPRRLAAVLRGYPASPAMGEGKQYGRRPGGVPGMKRGTRKTGDHLGGVKLYKAQVGGAWLWEAPTGHRAALVRKGSGDKATEVYYPGFRQTAWSVWRILFEASHARWPALFESRIEAAFVSRGSFGTAAVLQDVTPDVELQ